LLTPFGFIDRFKVIAGIYMTSRVIH